MRKGAKELGGGEGNRLQDFPESSSFRVQNPRGEREKRHGKGLRQKAAGKKWGVKTEIGEREARAKV